MKEGMIKQQNFNILKQVYHKKIGKLDDDIIKEGFNF
jgi:hypothetical protein